jgi:hypothetical protein
VNSSRSSSAATTSGTRPAEQQHCPVTPTARRSRIVPVDAQQPCGADLHPSAVCVSRIPLGSHWGWRAQRRRHPGSRCKRAASSQVIDATANCSPLALVRRRARRPSARSPPLASGWHAVCVARIPLALDWHTPVRKPAIRAVVSPACHACRNRLRGRECVDPRFVRSAWSVAHGPWRATLER